uniref:Uncharacterized protein n=1 Tax=Phyllostachys edulis TaxID=38705 RepID=D3IVF7_PHYED|nr:hypothetical protein [Phyllostachys edulis]
MPAALRATSQEVMVMKDGLLQRNPTGGLCKGLPLKAMSREAASYSQDALIPLVATRPGANPRGPPRPPWESTKTSQEVQRISRIVLQGHPGGPGS